MEEVKHEEQQLNDDKQLFLREFKKLKQQTESFADSHSKKRDYDAITPTIQPQNSADHKGAAAMKAQH